MPERGPYQFSPLQKPTAMFSGISDNKKCKKAKRNGKPIRQLVFATRHKLCYSSAPINLDNIGRADGFQKSSEVYLTFFRIVVEPFTSPP